MPCPYLFVPHCACTYHSTLLHVPATLNLRASSFTFRASGSTRGKYHPRSSPWSVMDWNSKLNTSAFLPFGKDESEACFTSSPKVLQRDCILVAHHSNQLDNTLVGFLSLFPFPLSVLFGHNSQISCLSSDPFLRVCRVCYWETQHSTKSWPLDVRSWNWRAYQSKGSKNSLTNSL